MHAALAADILAEDDELRIDLELVRQCPTHGLGESDDVACVGGCFSSTKRRALVTGQSAECLGRIAGVVRINPSSDACGIRSRPRPRRRESSLYITLDLLL